MKKCRILTYIFLIGMSLAILSQQVLINSQDDRLIKVETRTNQLSIITDISNDILLKVGFLLKETASKVSVLDNTIFKLIKITKMICKNQMEIQDYVFKNVDPKPSILKLRLATVEVVVGKYGGAGTIIKETEKYLYILTAKHITSCAGEVKVQLKEAKKFEFIRVNNIPKENVYESDSYDMALIKVPKPEGKFVTMELAKKLPLVGSTLYTMGHPLSLGYTVQKGIVSNYTARIFGKNKRQYMMISAPAFSGNSGGGCIDCNDNLIGIVVGIAYTRQEKSPFETSDIYLTHLVFVVPIDVINDFLQEIKDETTNNNRPEISKTT